MKAGRLLSIVVLAALALTLATASSALALPEFTPTGATVTATGGAGVLKGGENSVWCERNEISGGPTVHRFLIGIFRIHFFKCTSAGSTKSGCPVNSLGQTAGSGLILTQTLHIVVVLLRGGVLVGVRLLPVAGKEFLTLEGNECTKETKVTGELLGKPLPVGVSTTKAKLDFNAGEEEEAVKGELTYEGGEGNGEYKGLTAFSVSATDATNEEVGFSSSTELT
jgi:hypothetical protein